MTLIDWFTSLPTWHQLLIFATMPFLIKEMGRSWGEGVAKAQEKK